VQVYELYSSGLWLGQASEYFEHGNKVLGSIKRGPFLGLLRNDSRCILKVKAIHHLKAEQHFSCYVEVEKNNFQLYLTDIFSYHQVLRLHQGKQKSISLPFKN
jgi:hypothetical protein